MYAMGMGSGMRLWFLFVGGGICFDGDLLADCPLASDRCQIGGFEFSAGQKGGPECWLKTRAGISCHYLADYGMEACAGCYRNVRECGYFEKEDTVAVECPVAGDKCRFYSDTLIGLDDPDVPGCWKRDDEGEWTCLVLSKGCPSGFADITKCNGEVAEEKAAIVSIERCPEVDDMCWHSERAAFRMGDEKVPECWAVVDKSVKCRFKAELGGRCPKGSFDTSHCHAASEAQIRECPGEGAKCVFERKLYGFGEYGTPQCWQGTPGGFSCQPREDGCPDGMLDMTLCPSHRPPVDPRCPLLKDKCAIDGKKYRLSDGPECWRRTEDAVACAFAKPDGSCPRDYVLLATCPIREFPAVPILSTRLCPSPMDKCFDGKIKYFATDPTRPACWAKVGPNFLCINASPCPPATINTHSCNLLECPPYNTKCSSGNTLQDPDAPPCWKNTTAGFTCNPKSYSGLCQPSEVDISSCNRKPRRPPCPKATATCDYSDIHLHYALQEPRAPPCWTPTESNHQCAFPQPGSKCPRSAVDISQCPPPPTTSSCPPTSSICRHHATLKILTENNPPECWLKTNTGYQCWFKYELKDQECPLDAIDLETCQPSTTSLPSLGIFTLHQ